MTETNYLSKTSSYCPDCNSVVEVGILYSYNHSISIYSESNRIYSVEQIGKCVNCSNPFLIEEKVEEMEDNCIIHRTSQRYPNSYNIALKNAPEIVVRPFEEAQKCYMAQAYEACVIMCRKGVEAICEDKGENKGNLNSKLKKLKDNLVLENTLYNWSNELRELGNDGAHSHSKKIEKQDAKDSLDFLDAMITYLYHLVYQYENLKERRATGG